MDKPGPRVEVVDGVERYQPLRPNISNRMECGICGREEHVRGAFEEAAAHLRAQGWVIDAPPDGNDTCPYCVRLPPMAPG